MNKDKKKNILITIFLILFIITTLLVITKNISFFDEFIYNIVCKLRKSNTIDMALKLITKIGNVLPTIMIVIILLIILKKEYKILISATEIITISINQLLKHIIQRERPPLIERLIEEKGFSYPSGHAMMALCLYGTLIYIILREVKNKKIKIVLITLLSILILLIGLSRIYVRVHYPSDVLGGFLLTIPILIVTITIINNHFRGNSKWLKC